MVVMAVGIEPRLPAYKPCLLTTTLLQLTSGSVPVLEGEYYTPPVSQMRVNTPSKLITPPNLPTFSGQEPVPNLEGLIDQWFFQVDSALAAHTEEAVQSTVIGSVRGQPTNSWSL